MGKEALAKYREARTTRPRQRGRKKLHRVDNIIHLPVGIDPERMRTRVIAALLHEVPHWMIARDQHVRLGTVQRIAREEDL